MSQSPSSHCPIECRHHAGSAIVSIQTSSGAILSPSIELGSINGAGGAIASGGNASSPQIIIHEFLDEGEIHGHQQQQEHHHRHHHHHLPHTGGGGSITILTPPTPASANSAVSRINICINNPFSSGGHIKLETIPGPNLNLEPDSTTLQLHHGRFGLLDDVLVRIDKDERFYLGTIIAFGENNCLVRFDDGSERWSSFEEVTKLGDVPNGVETEATCVVCKEHKLQQVVYVCEACRRGYHWQCLPFQDRERRVKQEEPLMDGHGWMCDRCTAQAELASLSEELAPLRDKEELPYDPDTLLWDEEHRVNIPGHYCYCGEDGDWAKEMIQCRWCQQWFHGRCIRSLQYPIFLGDHYYLFLCSICNHGHEFVRRLELGCSDLVHLALYNLIMRNGRRLYDISRAIMPYIEDNLRTLQVPEQFANMTAAVRGDMVIQALRSNRAVFVNGTEFNKASFLWTLRNTRPPPMIAIEIPRGQTVTENMLQKFFKNGLHRFIPRIYLERSLVADAASRERMTDIKYGQPPFSDEDPRPVSISSETRPAVKSSSGSDMHEHGALDLASIVESPVFKRRGRPARVSNNVCTQEEVASNGETSHASVACSHAHATGNRRKYRTARRREKELALDTGDSSDSASTCTWGTTLLALIPPPKDFKGKNNPFFQELNPAVTPRPRQARIVKRRLNAKDILNHGRGKKRKLNHGGSKAVRLPPMASTVNVQPKLGSSNRKRKHHQQEPPATTGSSDSNTANKTTSSSASLSETAPAGTSLSKTHPHNARRLRPRASMNYSDSRIYRRRRDSYEHSESGVEFMQCNSQAGSRPPSSLSSSDGGERMPTINNGNGMPQQGPQPPQQPDPNGNGNDDLQRQRPPPVRLPADVAIHGMRTLPDGRVEYLIEHV